MRVRVGVRVCVAYRVVLCDGMDLCSVSIADSHHQSRVVTISRMAVLSASIALAVAASFERIHLFRFVFPFI